MATGFVFLCRVCSEEERYGLFNCPIGSVLLDSKSDVLVGCWNCPENELKLVPAGKPPNDCDVVVVMLRRLGERAVISA